MGALKVNGVCHNARQWANDVPRMDRIISPSSSCSSGSSFEKVSSPKSRSKLRRSTLDLSQIRSSSTVSFHQLDNHTITSTGHQSPKQDAVRSKIADGFVEDAIFHYISFLHSIILGETGIGRLLGEAQHHVANIFGFLFNSIFANNAETTCDGLVPEGIIQAHDDNWDEPPQDPPLSPARVSRVTSSDSVDEWGHFAYFQDELADEKSFIPSCAPRRASLETLDEDSDDNDFDDIINAPSF